METNFKRLPVKLKDMTPEQRKEYQSNLNKKYREKNKERVEDQQKGYRIQRYITEENLLKHLGKNMKSLDDLKQIEVKYNLCLEKQKEIEAYKLKIDEILKEIDLIIKG